LRRHHSFLFIKEQTMGFPTENPIFGAIDACLNASRRMEAENLAWLREQMHPYFFITLQNDPAAVARLAAGLGDLAEHRQLVLADRDKSLIVARTNRPGSLYDTLEGLQEREISYAQITQSYGPLPGLGQELEVQLFEFDRKEQREIAAAGAVEVPDPLKKAIARELRCNYPDFELPELDKLLQLLWVNNENYVRISPPRRVAQQLWLLQQGRRQGGVFLTVEQAENPLAEAEYRVMFAAGNPPQRDFLIQTMEVFKRLSIGIKRAYCLNIDTGTHPYFLGSFYVKGVHAALGDPRSELFARLRSELYNTQILSSASQSYRHFVTSRLLSGEDAALVDAFISFCHTNLAHNQPESFGIEDVMRAFHNHPEMTLKLVGLFRCRFDPALENRELLYARERERISRFIEEYNTGHRFLDDFRRTIFRCCLGFIHHSLKTNFFVLEKQALAFRLDPAYLLELGDRFTADLPPESPFRITFFSGRNGIGYHIGFSDIARGGWRTVLTRSRDDYATNANTLFRENYVLAHTQHLKNKDIYEGGSKMVVLLDVAGVADQEQTTQRLYKLQYGLINAFLDIFITDNGRARDPRVVDYYGEDEPIELGPDENMHDAMVELIARQSVRRGYLLGIGLISSKRVGINHKEFGVTSRGVVTCAEIALAEQGFDSRRDRFSVKFTGGPNGDVAGNAMQLLLERCPRVAIRLIIDGSGALYDPQGAKHGALRRILLKQDLDGFDPQALHPGGFLLYRNQRRLEGRCELYRKLVRGEAGLEEYWLTVDEFYREFNTLPFTVAADLFIPAGGRPETIDSGNWRDYLAADGSPSAPLIVEGANSFITPAARLELQQQGVLILRDATANKCGVISSSYEIIGNLLLSEKEFLAHKSAYVADVLDILETRAADEARLIFRRHRESDGSLPCTEISAAISQEVNANYARLFNFFQDNPQLCNDPLFRRVILSHLPRLLREEPKYRRRLDRLPKKYLYAILASEIASSLVYRGNRDAEFVEMIKGHLQRSFPSVADNKTVAAGDASDRRIEAAV
jgi:glutamate dehydrogenase